jgi:hypothetical protein
LNLTSNTWGSVSTCRRRHDLPISLPPLSLPLSLSLSISLVGKTRHSHYCGFGYARALSSVSCALSLLRALFSGHTEGGGYSSQRISVVYINSDTFPGRSLSPLSFPSLFPPLFSFSLSAQVSY